MRILDCFRRATRRKKIAIIFILALIITAILLGGFYLWKTKFREFKPSYAQTYRLINEKISQSAAIIVSLPFAMDKNFAQNNVNLDPVIEGKWLPSDREKEVIFKPKEKLELNRYYFVELKTPEGGLIRADFLAVEDPSILAIFPQENSEAPENSEITIVFNRPMVPLTTLGYLEEKDVPVEISPNTKGRFKWITTNNLQFIPEERLTRASRYKVKIDSLASMDGLPVSGKEFVFITRKLRYTSLTQGEIVYNQPLTIYFNQPVDLEKTKKEITLINNSTQKEVPFIAEYKSKNQKSFSEDKEDLPRFGFKRISSYFAGVASGLGLNIDLPGGLKKDEVDESVIEIYNKADKFGRKNLWDFENNYSLKIKKAYPTEGDIILDEGRTTSVQVAGPIRDLSAESSRTNYAGLDFFDPQGKLWVSFYEEIDLGKTKISASKLKEIGYGEKCKGEERVASDSVVCERVSDKKRIYLIFQAEQIGRGERLEINFEKIVNTEGLTINRETIKKDITSFPEFKVLKTIPQDSQEGASLTNFVLCSNSPILAPAKKDYKSYFSSNLDYEINYWNSSWRIYRQAPYNKCNVGEFETSISYGLMPTSNYSLDLKLEDVFGQRQNISLSFITGEMPDAALNFFHLQKGYNVTSPDKTKLTYAVENMEYVNMEICELSALDYLAYIDNPPDYTSKFIANCQKTVQKTLPLPKKYWINNYFNVDLRDYFSDPIGHYILTFWHPNYKKGHWDGRREAYVNAYERTLLTVTNLAVGEKRISPWQDYDSGEKSLSDSQREGLSNIYWVSNISSLEPVPGAKVSLYQEDKNSNLILSGTYNTDEQGIAKTDVVYNLDGAIITNGKDSTVIPNHESLLNWASSASAAQKFYLYSDKPIYRPGQEVSVKGIYRVGYDGNYEIFQDKNINFTVFNSKNDEILNKDLEINEFGTFNTKFVLDGGAPLGYYRACAKGYNCVYFEVQEYVPAAFEVNLKTDKEEYISKDTVNLEVDANYYFGVPLEGGEAEYTITSQNYYFDRYSDGYFDYDSMWYYEPPYNYGDRFILRGKVSIGADGKAKISQELDLEKLFKEKRDRKSKIVVIDVTVTNTQGRSISSQKSFILHAGEFYLDANSDIYFAGKNEKFNLKVKSTDIKGNETKVKDITFNVYKIDWIYTKRQEAGGGYQYVWEEKKDLVKTYKFDTDDKGNVSRELQLDKEGEYEIEASAFDKRGNWVFDTDYFYIYGDGAVNVKPTTDTSLEIEAEKTDLNVGDTGKIIIKSSYPRAKALISIERGKVFEYRIEEIRGNLFQYNFEVKEEYLPNVYVSVLLISQNPEVKFGSTEFSINTERKKLDIEVKSNKKYYLPGEEVVLDILTKDYKGDPVRSDVSLAVADLSVLALKGNPKKNPLIFFYDGFPLTVSTSSNIKDILIEMEIPTKGGAGSSDEALATKQRGVFRDTAFWQASVQTGADGRAQVKFTLPDNLTTWQTEALGVTKDTKLGVSYIDFITRKELMVVPLKPRFIVPGDVFYIGAQIFNQSQDQQKLDIKFDSQTLPLKDDKAEREIKIKAGKTETVYFKVEAPGYFKTGEHRFVISAKSNSLQDTVEQTIKIAPNNTYEVTATSNYSTNPVQKEYVFLPENVLKDEGELTIKSSATLAVFLSDSLNYLLQFPYGCSEQISSRLKAIAVVKEGLNLPNISEKFKLEEIEHQNKKYSVDEVVEIGLASLYNNQKWEGGFSLWKDGPPEFYATLHALDALRSLSAAGYKINQNSLSKAADYVYGRITNDRDLYQSNDTVIVAAYTLYGLPQFSKNNVLKQKIINIINDDLFINERISNSSLAYLAILINNKEFNDGLRKKVFNILDNRIDIDGRGAFLENKSNNSMWYYYETSIKNTALYLKALSVRKSDNPITEKVIRWLLYSRSKDGAWGSTHNTLSVIDAFVEYLRWKRETESNFLLDLLINDKKEGEFDFNKDTILDQFKTEIPIADLKFSENNIITLLKTSRNNLLNALYYDMSLKYYLPIDQLPPRDEGFSITREIYRLDDKKNEKPLREAKVGNVLRVRLQITVPEIRNFVSIEDYIPAGMEIVNLDLATEQKSLLIEEEYKRDYNYWRDHFDRSLYPSFEEMRDDRVFLYMDNLRPGVYNFEYYVRALTKGRFTHLPALVSEMYFPEKFGRTDGRYFEVK